MHLNTLLQNLSFDYELTEKGVLTNLDTKAVRVPRLTRAGVYAYTLSACGKTKILKIPRARLMALAFLPAPDKRRAVVHVNGNKTDDRLSNLRWGTSSDPAGGGGKGTGP